MHRRWDELPVAAGAAVTLAAGVLLILNVLVGALHGRYMKLCADVYGVEAPDQVPLSARSLLDGSYQSALGRRIGHFEPYFPLAVRLRNQMEFSLFGRSESPIVDVGKDDYLYEQEYVVEYCSRNLQAFMQTAPAWAVQIREMEDDAGRHGQRFLYVLTPSKAAQYPEFLPASPPCRASAADRTGVVPAWLGLLRRDGVKFVDTTAVVSAARALYDFPLFPRGGTHWNSVASALAAQAIERQLMLPPVAFTYRVSWHPDGIDMDDAGVMNMMFPLTDYPVPVVRFQPPPAAGCRPLRITIVGGSFMWGVGAALSHLPCSPRIVEYWYWSSGADTWPNGVIQKAAVDPARRDADLRAADVIIYEENEEVLLHSRHGALFYRWLRANWH